MKAFQKLVSVSAAFAMLMGGSLGDMPGEFAGEFLYSANAYDVDSGEMQAWADAIDSLEVW